MQSQLRRRLFKVSSERGLHYFMCRNNATAAVKGLKPNIKSDNLFE